MTASQLLEALAQVEALFDPNESPNEPPPAGAFRPKSYASVDRGGAPEIFSSVFEGACKTRRTSTYLDEAKQEQSIAFRATPSAGAIFPHELFLTSAAADGLISVFHYDTDVAALTCVRCKRPGGTSEAYAALENRILVVQLPSKGHWKYGNYAEILAVLDSGYQLASLYCVAAKLGMQPVMELAVSNHPAGELVVEQAGAAGEQVERLTGALHLGVPVQSRERAREEFHVRGKLPFMVRPIAHRTLLQPLEFGRRVDAVDAIASPSRWIETNFSFAMLEARRSVRRFSSCAIASEDIARVLREVEEAYRAITATPHLPTRLAILAFPTRDGRVDVRRGLKLEFGAGVIGALDDRASASIFDFTPEQQMLRECHFLLMIAIPTDETGEALRAPEDTALHTLFTAAGILGSLLQWILGSKGLASCAVGSFLNGEARRFGFFKKHWIVHQLAIGHESVDP